MGYSLTNIQKTTVILLSIYVAVGFCQSFDSSSRTLILGGSSNEKSYMFYNETTIIIHSVDVSTLYTNLFDRNSLASVSSQIQTTLSVNTYKTSTVVEESGVTYGYFVMYDQTRSTSTIVKIALFPQLGAPEEFDLSDSPLTPDFSDPQIAFANSDSLFIISVSTTGPFTTSTINRLPLPLTAGQNITGTAGPFFDDAFTSAFVDATDDIGYFGTSAGSILKIDLSIIEERVNSTYVTLDSLNTTYTAVETAVFDSIRRIGYFFAFENSTATDLVFKINLDTFTLIDANTPQNTLISNVISADVDLIGGQIYFGTAAGSIGHFSLPKFAFDGRVPYYDDTIKIHSVSLDVLNQRGYFFGDNALVYQVSLPSLCPNNCTNRGSCAYESCNCTSGFGGADCSNLLCPNACSGGGSCDYKSGNCSCFAGFTGDDCSIKQCKSNCLGNGICNSTSFTCICDAGFYGDDCSQTIPPVCGDFRSCDTCLANSSCGWCASTSLCTEGDLEGPFGDEYGCTMWYYDHCPAIAMTAFSAIFTGLAAILLLINMCSVFITDKNAPPGRADEFEVRRGYWRNQRSAKLWHMMDQIQFAAITAQFATQVPSIYGEFVSVFRWSVFGFPLPWSQRSQHFSSRQLRSIAQFATSTLAYPAEIFYGSLFWLGILFGVITVFFVLVKIYASATSRDSLTEFVKYRYVYTLLRLIFFAYFPLTVTASYVIAYGNVTSAIIAAIYLGIVHLGLIVFIFKLIPRERSKSHKLFKSEFLRKFGCIYQTFYFRRSWYSVLLLIKKLVMGLIVGFGQKSPVGTLVLLIVVQVVYVVQLFFVKPYLDHVHMFLDIITSVFNILVVLLMFSFLEGVADKTTTNIITIFVTMFLLITMVICFVTYLNSWFKMKNIHSLRQLWDRCRGRDQNDPEKSPDLNVDVELSTKHD